MAPEFSHVQLEDGSIAVVLGDFIGTVSSWHLVPSKENQLRMLYEAQKSGQKTIEKPLGHVGPRG